MFKTEIWLTPLILLPGVALLIISTSTRFAQLHDEFHRLVDHADDHAKIVARHLRKRCAFFRDALVFLYVSVGLFAIGSLIGGVLNALDPEAPPDTLWFVGGLTLLGIVALAIASTQLIRESTLSLRVINDFNDQIEHRLRSEK